MKRYGTEHTLTQDESFKELLKIEFQWNCKEVYQMIWWSMLLGSILSAPVYLYLGAKWSGGYKK